MDRQMARWAEYFGQLFTVDPPTEQLHTTGLQSVDADPPIDETAPSLDEVREAVAKLRGGKAAGVCNISAELLKAGGEAMIRGLHAALTAVWQSGTIPPDWKRGLVVPIWKGKGDRQDCNNYRGITLLSVPGKVLAHLLLTRIHSHLLKHQRPQQSGFTPGKSTTDRILALRVLVERRREFRQGMLAAYVDLKKAFDSVHRESLWDLLRLRGIPARTIGLITGLYSGTESAVKCGAGVSSFFPVNTGVRQGCVLAPSLFRACMDWVLDKVVHQSNCGASVGNTKITDLVFADDAVIFAESLEVLLMALEALHGEAKPLGLEVSWLKTKVQVFGELLDEAVQSVHACGEDIEILESFTYLGSAVHNDGGSRQEVLRRIGIAHGAMDSLSGSIWRCRYLCRRTKIRIFKSLVIPVLLYGCETWTLNSDLKRRINAFGNKCLRRIMGYRWDDYVSNQRLHESCKQCELDGDVDEELEKNLHSWTQLDVQDNVPLSPDMFPMEHRQIWVDLFIRYNTPVPSSAAVERLFSMGSDVMRPKRSSLTAKNFEKLVFLKGNMNLLKGRWELEDSDDED
ncbi:LINE-1 retrotransposable element ORF2 protein [Chionoecetes opilio]|uniref:LINE-1 retrotransposable element ORF2 protein n=1 Tax=Chionoecetes opilio TaxID=41210 RepID=A0A8J4YGZ8_CHIOP|nr:LINE-1 retrotransposable element ORF2 protein [Chionoecetes opilio]